MELRHKTHRTLDPTLITPFFDYPRLKVIKIGNFAPDMANNKVVIQKSLKIAVDMWRLK